MIQTRDFSKNSKGEKATLYRFENEHGMVMEVSDFGATLYSLLVPDKDGNLCDVVLGYDDPIGYEGPSRTFFGVTVGRSANRIANGRFELNGKTYQLDQNQNGNNLHSGMEFYSFRIWQVKAITDHSITFALHSPDGDQGYPGTVDIEVTYTLTSDNGVKIDYYAVPEEDTILNLTNHSFFNLNGHASGSILEQWLWVDADAFTPTNGALIPTGEIRPVEGTPMDFRTKKMVGRDIAKEDEALILGGGGYDHNWCLNNNGKFAKVVELSSDLSGITMEAYTDLPGVHIYSGNYLREEVGKQGIIYKQYQGICFETQHYPDAINHENFPSPIVRKGKEYKTTTIYKFV